MTATAAGFPIGRTAAAGLVGGAVLNGAMFLTFGLIGFGGFDADGILLDPALQSPKLIAVWTEIEPLPLIVANPAPMVVGLFAFAVGHAFIYRWLAPAWPPGVPARAARLAALTFVLSYLFFEFFTPFNQYGEPLALLGLELAFWVVVAAAEATAIAAVLERPRRRA